MNTFTFFQRHLGDSVPLVPELTWDDVYATIPKPLPPKTVPGWNSTNYGNPARGYTNWTPLQAKYSQLWELEQKNRDMLFQKALDDPKNVARYSLMNDNLIRQQQENARQFMRIQQQKMGWKRS